MKIQVTMIKNGKTYIQNTKDLKNTSEKGFIDYLKRNKDIFTYTIL
jgi:hypothetical protein